MRHIKIRRVTLAEHVGGVRGAGGAGNAEGLARPRPEKLSGKLAGCPGSGGPGVVVLK